MLKIQTSLESSSYSQSSDAHKKVDTYKKGNLLIVDDEPDLLITLEILFSPYYAVKTALSGKVALEIIEQGFIPQVILADQRMPEMTGTEFLSASMQIVPQSVRVVLTGYTDVQDITNSINQGNVYRFLTKPWRNADLIEIIRACFDHYHLSEEKIALTRALQELQTSIQEKNDIMEIVVHDLKNPLHAIIGLNDIVQQGEANEFNHQDYQRFAGEIAGTANRMFTLIRNLLNVHSLETNAISLQPIPLQISALAALNTKDFQPQAAAKNITLHVHSTTSEFIFVDEVLCHQAMENLISNAIKYSPLGKNIWITTAQKGNNICFSVRDEGPGISAEDQTKLFRKFTKLSAQPTAGENSTGLGLSLVKKIVEKMNGKVYCDSELGKGTTFCIEFPIYRHSG